MLSSTHAATLLVAAAQRAGTLRALGDVVGHPFHGNQWTDVVTTGPDKEWASGAGVNDGDVADRSIAWAAARYPRAALAETKRTGLDPRDELYRGEVDGLRVRTDIPNTDSISATFNDSYEYDELPGIREVRLDDIDVASFASADDRRRVQHLAEAIKDSGEIAPLIIVVDGTRRPWVLEGGHRVRALKELGKKLAPAVVLVDHTKVRDEDLRGLGDVAGHPFHGNQWTAGHGTETWTKGDDETGYVLNGTPLVAEPHPDFSKSIANNIDEPPMPEVPKGKHAAAGMVITEPDGRVWLVQPRGRYGGYRNTFPKGTIDKGETPREAAAREVWEETGLVAQVTGHLADVERTTSVTRFYEGKRIGGAPWTHGKETYAVTLVPFHGKGIENALKKVGGQRTTDHDVLDALRGKMRAATLRALRFDEDQPRDDAGRWTDSGGDWPKGLKNISGAKGSNPGGLYKDASGQKWYVKRYNDPRQAQTEHIANEVYRAVGVAAPHSVLGEGGDYASKIIPTDGTLGQVGITKERADRILDGFAADVFLDNWDAVGTGHDNILVHGGKVTRIDQGGTLLFRAQGAPKPEAGLEKIDEWHSLVEKNHYYAQIFKAAGVKNGDALGERAAKQIDRIVRARPEGGWKTLVDRVAPKADAKFREKVAHVLESRQKLLEKKRDELRARAAEMRTLHLPGEHDQQSHAGDDGPKGEGEKKKKAPKAPPVPIESKKAAYDDVKKGATFKATAQKYGMTQGQLSGYVWKVDQAKKKAEEGIEEELAAKTVVKAEDVKPEAAPVWSQMTPDQKLTYAHEQGYEWKQKPNSTHGNHAWFDKEGNQVSAFGPKETYREKLDTINYGQGIVPKVPDVAPAPGQWPISVDAQRAMSDSYAKKMSTAHGTWAKNLTVDELAAISNYTGSGYSELNEQLRAGSGLSTHLSKMSASLNSSIEKAPVPPPPDLVWRGISSDKAAALFAGLKNGDQLTLKGFQSSSIKPSFAHSWGAGKIIFEIKPKKGIYAKLHSNHPHEYEYLLPHNAKYTVRGISHVKFEGIGSKVRVLQLEMH